MQDIAQSTYDFRVMRENGSVYVDKTGLLYPFIRRDRDALYFVSRPRRFGKSLMLSTLNYLFQGRRDLFKGLAIDSLDYDWAEYPVISLDFYTPGLRLGGVSRHLVGFLHHHRPDARDLRGEPAGARQGGSARHRRGLGRRGHSGGELRHGHRDARQASRQARGGADRRVRRARQPRVG